MVRRAFLAMCVLTTGPGCREGGDGARPDAAAVTVTSIELPTAYRLVDSVTLEQPDSALIVRVSGLDQDARGILALGDASEGNVKLFSPSGRLLRVIGRKGNGPGEFQEPRFPRFGADGSLHVADGGNGRVSVFSSDGKLQRTFQLGKLTYMSGFVRDGRGGYLVASEDSDGYVLFHFDSEGGLIRRLLRIRDVRPRGEPDGPYWRNVRQFKVGCLRDTAYVTLSYSDSLWRVDLATGKEDAIAITPPGYSMPSPPREEMKNLGDLNRWSTSLQMAVSLSAGDAGIVVNFVQGVLNFGDPNTAVIRTDAGHWVAVRNAPAFLLSGPTALVSLASAGDSTSGRVVLAIYERATAKDLR